MSRPPCHLAPATDLAGKVRGTTVCGIRPSKQFGVHWTDETAKVRGCPTCLEYARSVASGRYTLPIGIKSTGAPV